MLSLNNIFIIFLQYELFQRQSFKVYAKQPNSGSCVHSTVSIEHFFKIVFSEFMNNQPVCVCVQMCKDYPTYCYPSGCFKKLNASKKSALNEMPASRPDRGIDKTFVTMNDQKEILTKVEKSFRAYDTKNVRHEKFIDTSKTFKDLVLKYKKVPKFEMRYNLREKIKDVNRKLNNVSIPKWLRSVNLIRSAEIAKPMPQYNKINNKHRSQYLISMFPNSLSSYKSKHVKKYLNKRENNNEIKEETVIMYDVNINETVEYSSKLIKNDSVFKDSVQSINDNYLYETVDSDILDTSLVVCNTSNEGKYNSTEYTSDNINLKNIDKKYEHPQNLRPSVSESIQIMSNEIDKHNNKSLELKKQIDELDDEIILLNPFNDITKNVDKSNISDANFYSNHNEDTENHTRRRSMNKVKKISRSLVDKHFTQKKNRQRKKVQ